MPLRARRQDPVTQTARDGTVPKFQSAPRAQGRASTVALLSRRRPPAGKPPTTAARKVTNSAGRPPHELLQHLAARSRPLACLESIRPSQPDRPACAWPFGIGLPRQGTEVVAPECLRSEISPRL